MSKKIILSTIIIAFLLSSLAAQAIPESARHPDSAYTPIDNTGTVVRYNYTNKHPFKDDGKVYKKTALVYTPYGFDANDTETKYNVLYLMHGGSQSPEWYFGGEYCASLPKTILDHLIYEGQIEPLVVCAVSYYNEYTKDATTNCKLFYKELKNHIMPDFEEKYHIKKDRKNRAFGGFSMGGLTTWAVFENALDDVSLFLPISGDSWVIGGNKGGTASDMTALILSNMVEKQGFTKNDFKIFAGTGAREIATPNLLPQIEAMKKYPEVFEYGEYLDSGNFYCLVCPNSGHDLQTVLSCMYYGLPKLFSRKTGE